MARKRILACIMAGLVGLGATGCGTGELPEDGEFLEDGERSERAAVVGVYQAEAFTYQKGCVKATNQAGYTGSGFMDYGGNGSLVMWNNVNAPSAGKYKLVFRYANGSSGARRCVIRVNGTDVGNVSFDPTGNWKQWRDNSIEVNLKQGINKIRVAADTGSGGPNLDKMTLTSSDGGTGTGGLCAVVDEGGTARLSCSSGQVINSIAFASYGKPSGTCPSFEKGSCHASSSQSKVESLCLNRGSCSVGATNSVFGDPCPGTGKKLAIAYSCGAGGTNPNGGDDSGSSNKTIYTTESAPDLDTSDRLDFKNKMLAAGYKDLGDTKRCSVSQMKSLLQRSDIKTLYHSSHGFDGGVALMDGSLTCGNTVQYMVENVIYATCLTLKDTCWKSKMGATSKNILGYTKVSYDGIANTCAKQMGENLKAGQSYIKAWYAANTSISALKDRWCGYVREGNNIVEYSARSGNVPRAGLADLEPMDADGIVFVESAILADRRTFDSEFSPLRTTAYEMETGVKPRVDFSDNGVEFLRKGKTPMTARVSSIARSFGGIMPRDAQLEGITPIEADGEVVAQRVRYIRVRDNLEVRSNGLEHHKEAILNGQEIAAWSEYWPRIEVVEVTQTNVDPLMSVQDTAVDLATELLTIAKESVAIVGVAPCYGSQTTGAIVPAHCFSDTDGTIWVVNAYTGDLVN